MSAEPEPPRLDLPSDGSGCGGLFAAAFVGLFVALAVYNLVTPGGAPFDVCGTIASVLWLALVAFCLTLAVWQVGVWGSVVAVLGGFSLRHFADARREDDRVVIGFGHQLFGRRWYYLRLAPDDVTSVGMSSGQATAFAGRDMGDWSVVLWYAPDEVYIVGPARPREETAELLAAVVAFLRAAGVNLEPSERENEFRRRRE